jgi:hypothetical protein
MPMFLKSSLVLLGKLCIATVVLVLAGCGATGSEKKDAVIEKPTRPSVKDCGHALASLRMQGKEKRRSSAESPPLPGIYRYDMTGSQAVPGAALRAKELPAHTKLFVTPSRKIGNATCFKVQKRFASDIANTSTYVIRGENIYLVSLLIQALGESQEIRPNPAVLSASSAGSSWSGQFGGATYGSYTFSVLGKQTYRVGARRLRAIGISSSVSYRGAVSGTQVATAWISLDHDVVVAEKVKSRQNFGVSALHLRSRSHLISLQPEPLPES